ncbi:hypothetical protein M422DRAFT_277063 [Sphaerobolus stellatus SS14]|uniref:Uncharacterized protein n=1 Tax=Sphaerobolus stellatus (strain SS14) TaxID=990650 RepID=A0A0C9T179_SPHS4|nr:hypothetical protein M422DRAFT_277063 [Sphaerobolus stellatus SS14]
MLSFYDIPSFFLTIRAPVITVLFLSAPVSRPTLAFWSAVSQFLEASPTLVALELEDIGFLTDDILENSNHLCRFLEALRNIQDLTLRHMDILPFFQRILAEQAEDRYLCSALEHISVIFSQLPADLFMEFVLHHAGLEAAQALKSIHLDRFWGLTSSHIALLRSLNNQLEVKITHGKISPNN